VNCQYSRPVDFDVSVRSTTVVLFGLQRGQKRGDPNQPCNDAVLKSRAAERRSREKLKYDGAILCTNLFREGMQKNFGWANFNLNDCDKEKPLLSVDY
jgi:hypothetical protein